MIVKYTKYPRYCLSKTISFVLTFPKYEKKCSLSTQLFAKNGKQSRYMFYVKTDSKSVKKIKLSA
jgi:hypothetical protein